MAREKYKFRMYERLAGAAQSILGEAEALALDSELKPAEPRPGPEPPRPSGEDRDALNETVGRIRELVKEAYGDAYDACPTVSTGAGLALCKMAVVPANPDHGLRGRPIVVVPRQKPSELLAGCDPLPPKYRILPEFGAPSGLILPARSMSAAVVPLVGASYGYHGIVAGTVSMVANSISKESLEAVAATAEACLPCLAAVFGIGTGVPGCGFTRANDDGVSDLHAGLGELASEYDVPFIVDNSPAIPFLGPDLKKVSVSAVVYGPYGPGRAGIIIGAEDAIMPVLQMADIAGGKAAYTHPVHSNPVLPDLDQLRDLLSLLTEVHENPERYARIVTKIYDIVTSEFAQLADEFKTVLRFQKNPATLSVEVNYEDTWNEGLGFPAFSANDVGAGTHLLREGLKRMGVTSISVTDASIVIGAPRHELRQAFNPQLDQERLRLEVQALVSLLRIIGAKAGYPL